MLEAERNAILKDDFLASISHEFRNPLTAILLWVQVLRNGNRDPGALRSALEAIERSAHAQAQLIDDLLDMSRILCGCLRIEPQTFNPVGAVEAAIAAASATAIAKRVRVTSFVDAQCGEISGDPTRIQQVVSNLLINAISSTPAKGKVELRVTHDESHIEISVNDTGAGIKPAFLPYVFDYFRQQDASSTPRDQRRGVGLSIVKRLVELHDGSVCAHSSGPGKGSTFRVSLPLAGGFDAKREFPQGWHKDEHCLNVPAGHGLQSFL